MAGTQNPRETLNNAMKEQWEIHYSRYFNLPHLPPTCERPEKIRPTGSWVSSSSTASLQLINHNNNNAREPLLVVSFRGEIHESLKDARNVGLPSKDYGSETPSPSDFISSNGIHYRGGEEFSKVNPAGNFEPLVQPPLNCEGLQYPCSKETILSHHSEGTRATLPPSFTAFLSDSCTGAEQEPSKVLEEVNFKSQMAVLYSQLYIPEKLMDSYATDSSFREMLQKIEMAID